MMEAYKSLQNIMKITWLIIVLVVIIGVAWFIYTQPLSNRRIDVDRISQEVVNGGAVLLDVRTEEERQQDGYAVNSTHFPIEELRAGELPAFAKDMTVYTYCRSGARAGEAEEILEAAGFANVENIGGLSDWEASGGVVVRQ